MSKILFGITGGIAAYKACSQVSSLTQSGHDVHVVMTENAKEFVGPATFRALSKNPVIDKLFADNSEPVPHISLSEEAELVVVAPATANIIGKAANGLADDILSSSLLAARCPKLFVPSMNDGMWENNIVQENIKKLKEQGCHIIEPANGYLACGTVGKGRFPDEKIISDEINNILSKKQILVGKKIIITGGGTQEEIDAVRVITNKSSGRMGLALKKAAEGMGAEVKYIEATTVNELKENIAEEFDDADALIMAAAVSDYKPLVKAEGKIKSDEAKMTIELKKNEDLLEFFGKQKKDQLLIGFALESQDLINNAKEKLKKKNLDLIVANDVSAIGAGSATITIIDKNNDQKEYNDMDKNILAEKILEKVCRNLS